MQQSSGRVREWKHVEGEGVVDTPATPGGCWFSFSALLTPGLTRLSPGQMVGIVWEVEQNPNDCQHGYGYRATQVWLLED
jgi:CspA family cold shock protein